MGRTLVREERLEIGSYSVVTEYYSDDSIRVSLYDALEDLIEYIEVYDVDETDYGFSRN